MVVEIQDDSHNRLPSKLHLPPTQENAISDTLKKNKNHRHKKTKQLWRIQ